MVMKPTEFDGAVPVDGYGPGFFRVGGKVTHGPVLVVASGGQPWAGLEDTAVLLALSGQVDVLFLGTGATIIHPSADLIAQMKAAGIMVEVMASPTAARIYNVTLSEGRRVACALLPL